jgi:hypothetical protein
LWITSAARRHDIQMIDALQNNTYNKRLVEVKGKWGERERETDRQTERGGRKT